MIATGLLAAGPSFAEALQGRIQIQYDNAERSLTSQRQESWLAAGEANYTTVLRKSTELFAQARFSRLSYPGRPERFQRPEGLIRLAHRLYGLTATYQPGSATDARGVERSQQNARIDAYVQPANLPHFSGYWNRIHRDAAPGEPGSAAEIREMATNYDRGILNVHGTVGDRHSEDEALGTRRKIEDHVTAGTALRVQRHGVDAGVSYDYTQLRTSPGTPIGQTSVVHMVGANGGRQFSPNTSATLVYTYRRVAAVAPAIPATNEHNGQLNLAHTVSKVLQVSGGAGVRDAALNGRQETESYVVGSATARAQVVQDWRANAGWSHSWNWLPDSPSRMVDAVDAGTQMRLAKGLNVNGALGVTRTELPPNPVVRDTLGGSAFYSLQASAGFRAQPLPPITFTGNTRRFNSGASLSPSGPVSTAHQVGFSWAPSTDFQSQGSWGLTKSAEREQTTWIASLQWNASHALQLSGNYSRSSSPTSIGVGLHTSARETYGARAVVLFNRDLVGTVQYSEADPGLATHRSAVTVTLSQAFRR